MPTGVEHFICNSVGESLPQLQAENALVVMLAWQQRSTKDYLSPEGADLVYEGLAAGSRYDEKGGTSDTLCLPKDPQYRSYTANTWTAELYGVEYEFNFW